jgi:hypothetical protein
MKNPILISLSLMFLACQHASLDKKVFRADASNGHLSDLVAASDVVVIPQWHLSPQVDTRLKPAALPQNENQLAIYRQLVSWSQTDQLKTVVAEGCEGKIENGFNERFNGWTLEDLQKLKADQLDTVITQIGIKLKAKLDAKIQVVCGDNLELIKKHQLVLSDLRGLLGFRMRIEGSKKHSLQRTEYVNALKPLLKLPSRTGESATLTALNTELRKKVSDFESILSQRNESFARAIHDAAKPAAVVIGAIHITDLEKKLQAQKISAVSFYPNGLKGDENELIDAVKKLVK